MSKTGKAVSSFISEIDAIFLLQDIENAKASVKLASDEFSGNILNVLPPSPYYAYCLLRRALEKIDELDKRIKDLCWDEEEDDEER